MIKITWSQTSTYGLHISPLPMHSLIASSSFWLQWCIQSLPHHWQVVIMRVSMAPSFPLVPRSVVILCCCFSLLLLPAHNSSTVQLFLALYCPAPVLSLNSLSKLPECHQGQKQKLLTHQGLLLRAASFASVILGWSSVLLLADVSTNAVCFLGYLQDISFYKLSGSIRVVWERPGFGVRFQVLGQLQ